jgi:hypothetical protein
MGLRKFELALFIISSIIVIVWISYINANQTSSVSLDNLLDSTKEIIECQNQTQKLFFSDYDLFRKSAEDCKDKIDSVTMKASRAYIESKNETEKREFKAMVVELRADYNVIQLQENYAKLIRGNLTGEEIDSLVYENKEILQKIIVLIDELEEYNDTILYQTHYKKDELMMIKQSFTNLLYIY